MRIKKWMVEFNKKETTMKINIEHIVEKVWQRLWTAPKQPLDIYFYFMIKSLQIQTHNRFVTWKTISILKMSLDSKHLQICRQCFIWIHFAKTSGNLGHAYLRWKILQVSLCKATKTSYKDIQKVTSMKQEIYTMKLNKLWWIKNLFKAFRRLEQAIIKGCQIYYRHLEG